jgi:hypothetical protein
MPRLPANNRMHSSSALQTHSIWAESIGYDPYAPSSSATQQVPEAQPLAPNPFDKAQGLLSLARLTGGTTTEVRGSCRKCGGVGHLTFQCRNTIQIKKIKEDVSSTTSDSDSEPEDDLQASGNEAQPEQKPISEEKQERHRSEFRSRRQRSRSGSRSNSPDRRSRRGGNDRSRSRSPIARKRSRSPSERDYNKESDKERPSVEKKRKKYYKDKKKKSKKKKEKKGKKDKKKDKKDKKGKKNRKHKRKHSSSDSASD